MVEILLILKLLECLPFTEFDLNFYQFANCRQFVRRPAMTAEHSLKASTYFIHSISQTAIFCYSILPVSLCILGHLELLSNSVESGPCDKKLTETMSTQ